MTEIESFKTICFHAVKLSQAKAANSTDLPADDYCLQNGIVRDAGYFYHQATPESHVAFSIPRNYFEQPTTICSGGYIIPRNQISFFI